MIILEEAGKDRTSLVNEINRFNSSTKPKTLEKKQNKKDTHENLKALCTGRRKVLDAYRVEYFLLIKAKALVFPTIDNQISKY